MTSASPDSELHLAVTPPAGPADSAAPLPALERLLGRADVRRHADISPRARALRLFGLPPGTSLPIAALTRLADTGSWDPGWWLRLDPVHMRPDRDSLVLFPPGILELGADEAAVLAGAVRDYLQAEGLVFESRVPERWYLRLDTPPECRFTDLPDAVGQSMLAAMPEGRDAGRFRRMLNELQMLLHAHPVNREREAAGRPTANSVWIWGGGAFDELAPAEWDALWTDNPLLAGLGMLAGNEPAAPPASLAECLAAMPSGRALVVLEEPDSGDMTALERDWFEPLWLALREKLLDRAVIHAPAHSFSLTPGLLRRFWRRRQPASVLQAGVSG